MSVPEQIGVTIRVRASEETFAKDTEFLQGNGDLWPKQIRKHICLGVECSGRKMKGCSRAAIPLELSLDAYIVPEVIDKRSAPTVQISATAQILGRIVDQQRESALTSAFGACANEATLPNKTNPKLTSLNFFTNVLLD